VHALHSHDDGSGPALYVGGNWAPEPGFPYDHLARWDGATWSDVGGGVSNIIWTMTTYDSGGGPTLYLGGPFFSAGGGAVPVSGVAEWNGSTWSAPFIPSTTGVQDMHAAEVDGTATLYMAGTILDGVAAWDGSTLTALGDLSAFVDCVTVFDTGSGPQIACGGPFSDGPGQAGLSHVARWDGSGWATMGEPGFGDAVRAVSSHYDGDGPALYVGGHFYGAYGLTNNGIARWKNGAWDDLNGSSGPAVDFVDFDDGTGNALYACGQIKPSGGGVYEVARWNGSAWSQVGDVSGFGAYVDALHVHDDGTGKALYASGSFASISGVPAANVARWDGSTWSALGPGPGGPVLDMETYDDGSGSQLYVGGTFTTGGGAAGDYIARWDGATWTGLGGGPSIGSGHRVLALEVADFFGDQHLYVGGVFDDVLGIPFTEGLARFDGSGWSAVPFAAFTGDVHTLQVYLDGAFPGPALIVGGAFEGLGLFTIENLASWTGVGWTAFDGGVNDTVSALTVHDAGDGLGPLIVTGGDFTVQLGEPASGARLARWGGCWAGVQNWTDLGFALGGTFGDPLLVGSGSLAPASLNDVDLTNAFPSALAGLFLSLTSTPVPFMGGTLVPFPFIDPIIYVTTSPLGEIPLQFVMPEGFPPGSELFVQWGISDAGGPNGVALSNAIRGDTP
jgi:hypothetical protein